jgi:hypothetical protein
MAKTYKGIAFGKVDVDENADASVEFEISSVGSGVHIHIVTVLVLDRASCYGCEALQYNLTHLIPLLPQIPTFVLFDGTEMIQRFSGADPNRLEVMIKDLEKR